MATHSSMLAWRIPWAEEPGRLQSMELPRVRHDLATKSPSHLLIYLFICGCAGSLLLHLGSSPLVEHGLSSAQSSRSVAHAPSCPMACGFFPDQGSNSCPLHWQVDFPLPDPQGSPPQVFLEYLLCVGYSAQDTLMDKSTMELCPQGAWSLMQQWEERRAATLFRPDMSFPRSSAHPASLVYLPGSCWQEHFNPHIRMGERSAWLKHSHWRRKYSKM